MAPKWTALAAIMAVLVYVAHRVTKDVLSHEEVKGDALDEEIDEIVWAFYKDWTTRTRPRSPVAFMSALKDLGRLFDENDPDEMLLRLHNRLKVLRQILTERKSSKAQPQHNEGESPPFMAPLAL